MDGWDAEGVEEGGKDALGTSLLVGVGVERVKALTASDSIVFQPPDMLGGCQCKEEGTAEVVLLKLWSSACDGL